MPARNRHLHTSLASGLAGLTTFNPKKQWLADESLSVSSKIRSHRKDFFVNQTNQSPFCMLFPFFDFSALHLGTTVAFVLVVPSLKSCMKPARRVTNTLHPR